MSRPGLLVHLPHREGTGAVAVVPADGQLGLGVDALKAHAGTHVNGDDVPFLQPALPGDAVDYLVVDRDTGGTGKTVQVEKGGITAMLDDKAVHGVVQLPGGDARPHQRGAVGPGLGGEPPGLPGISSTWRSDLMTMRCAI